MRIFLLTFLTVCVFRVSAAPETPFRHGRLDNGLTYYIRATGASAGKADFYLVQNVGALMEEDHQNGLAHVLEHMAFHATEHFPEGVPAFLKRRGIQDLNAYTGADETVYHIDGVPTTDSGLVDSCLLILHDWSGFLQLRADEMEIERKVILEERRQGMDLSQRMQSQLNAYLYNHSKYATHDVIGTPEVLNHFTADEVRAYYHDFYRPDQQAVIVLGRHRPRCRGGRSETPLCRHSEARECQTAGDICHSGQRRAPVLPAYRRRYSPERRRTDETFPQAGIPYTRRTGERPVVPGVLQSNRRRAPQ